MRVFAYGAEKVRALELALGGHPPKPAGDKAIAELTRLAQERIAQRRAFRATVDPLLERASAPLRQLINADADAVSSVAELQRFLKSRIPPPPRKPTGFKIEPRMVTGSGILVKVPPYDLTWQFRSGDVTQVDTDAMFGNYGFVTSYHVGDEASAGAGLGIWFFATDADPQQRFAAWLEYDFSWSDLSSFWFTGQTEGDTDIWVWGASENTWVAQQSYFPSWSDSITNFAQNNGSNGDGSAIVGSGSLEIYFPTAANSWYLVWVFSRASNEWTGGWSWAYSFLGAAVPFVVFGGLV
jgi:hypothetical protein